MSSLLSVHALPAKPAAKRPDDWRVVPSQLLRSSEGHWAGLLTCTCPLLRGEDHARRGVQRIQGGLNHWKVALIATSINGLLGCWLYVLVVHPLQIILQKEFYVVYALAHVCGQDRSLLASLLLRIFRHEKTEAPLLRTLNDREISMEGRSHCYCNPKIGRLRHLNRLVLKNYERIISLKAISDNHVA